MSNKKINIAIIGLGFGAEFIPIYKKHPNANLMAICQRTKSKLDEIGNAFGIEKRYTDYDQLLKDPEIDAVHINTPIPDHAIQSIKALKAGKHVACTVPMATTVAECEEIVKLVKANKLTYMMMETVVYAREFLFMKELYEKGELGKIQFIKASHQQDMDGWPNYWPGLPPCITLPTAWARSWGYFVRTRNTFLALVQEQCGKNCKSIIILLMQWKRPTLNLKILT